MIRERELKEILREFGISDYEIVCNSHWKISFLHRGRVRIVVASITPRHKEFMLRAIRRDVRRQMEG